MAHVFDTGLDKPQRTKVLEAVVSKLSVLKKTGMPAYYVPHLGIKMLPRLVRGEGDEKGLSMLAAAFDGQTPAFAIAVGRLLGEGAAIDPEEATGELDVVLYIASGHQGDLVTGRLIGDAGSTLSDTADPGIFTMLEHARQLLLGQELGVAGIRAMRFRDEDELGTFDNYSVWEQRYAVGLDLSVNSHRGITQLLLEIEGRHKLDGIPDGHAHDPLITTLSAIPPPES